MNGTLTTVDDRPALRFERRLNHSVERVWRAVTEPAELERWFIGPVPWTPELGETFEDAGQRGEITRLDEQQAIEWTWGDERFAFELRPDGHGCVLVFTHVLDDRSLGAQHASGWEAYFSRLDAHLDGGHLGVMEAHEGIEEVHEGYAERFGLDPEVGRRTFARMRASA
jgi:uncharacterized protein YndB with AHSA1/START domain